MVTIQPPVKAVEITQNRKLGEVSVTLVSQASCPKSCPFYKAGCYAEAGPMGIHTSRLNKSLVTDQIEIAKCEAEAILGLKGRRPLRLHVVGDTTTSEAAKIVSEAARSYSKRQNQPVWGYTHQHDIPREAWDGVSMLRSCESIDQVRQSHKDGYAAALVVSEFKQDTVYEIAPGIKGVPCPQITGRAKTCEDCGLCMNDKKLLKSNLVILFAAHGSGTKKIKRMLDLRQTQG